MVHLLVRLEILSPQVKSGPQRGSRLWLRPQAALCISGSCSFPGLTFAIDSGGWLDDPLTIHGRPELMVHWKAQPEAIERRLKTDIVFTFVRHPLKRAYSCFNEKIHFTSIYGFGKVRQFVDGDDPAVGRRVGGFAVHAFKPCLRHHNAGQR